MQIKRELLVSIVHALHNFEEEPCAAFGLVEERLEHTGSRRIMAAFAYSVGGTLHLHHMFVILHQPPHHLTCRYVVAVVILDALQLVDMADTANSCPPDTTHTLGQDINGLHDFLGLLVEGVCIVTIFLLSPIKL
jgi:hypothetical protein